MTIKDLYEKAKGNGMENAEIVAIYDCSDDYYGLEADIQNKDIEFHKRRKIIVIHFD